MGLKNIIGPSLVVIAAIFMITKLASRVEKFKLVVGNCSDVQWAQEIDLDGRGIQLKVAVDDTDPAWVVMEMSAPTTGYVAIGFSPDGKMLDSDIIAGWVDKNGAHILDTHVVGYVRPVTDLEQNCQLLCGQENEDGTMIRFRRPWQTPDKDHDWKLTPDSSLHIIWTYIDKDPVNDVISPTHYFGNTDVQLSIQLPPPAPNYRTET